MYSESKTFDKRALAKEWAARREEALRNDPGAMYREQHRDITIGDLIDRYVTEREEIDALGRSKAAHIKMLRSMPLAQLKALELTPQQVVAHVRDRRLSGTGGATVSNDLIWLRVIFRYARAAIGVPVDVHVLDDAAITARSERLTGRSKRRKRRPTSEELVMIGDWFRRPNPRGTSREVMYLLMWFAIYSCRRIGEICSLRLDDFDRDHGVWLVRDVKNPGGSSGNDLEMMVPDRLLPVIDAAIQYVSRDDNRLFRSEER
ncbi:MAG: hypothetical protein RBR56_09180, partial [Halothiobacillus sp.]|nr:hypothetical protein [Halothiobacillus sp.]